MVLVERETGSRKQLSKLRPDVPQTRVTLPRYLFQKPVSHSQPAHQDRLRPLGTGACEEANQAASDPQASQTGDTLMATFLDRWKKAKREFEDATNRPYPTKKFIG